MQGFDGAANGLKDVENKEKKGLLFRAGLVVLCENYSIKPRSHRSSFHF